MKYVSCLTEQKSWWMSGILIPGITNRHVQTNSPSRLKVHVATFLRNFKVKTL